MKALPIPDAALRDTKAGEVARVWIAEQGLHCSLTIGVYHDQGLSEPQAWGMILSDMSRHIADALHGQYGLDRTKVLDEIRKSYLSEIEEPTSPVSGGFVDGAN